MNKKGASGDSGNLSRGNSNASANKSSPGRRRNNPGVKKTKLSDEKLNKGLRDNSYPLQHKLSEMSDMNTPAEGELAQMKPTYAKQSTLGAAGRGNTNNDSKN